MPTFNPHKSRILEIGKRKVTSVGSTINNAKKWFVMAYSLTVICSLYVHTLGSYQCAIKIENENVKIN